MKSKSIWIILPAVLMAAGCESPSGYTVRDRPYTTRERTAVGAYAVEPVMPPPPSVQTVRVLSRPEIDRTIATWKSTPRQAAQAMLQKYGLPQEATPNRLVWYNNGPWKRTELVNEEIRSFPMAHNDALEQVIEFRVPPDKLDELARYDGSVVVERTKGEVSARCDREEMNFLALNLANDIVNGTRSVEEARIFYARAARAFKRGERPEYTQRLQFLTPTSAAADPDEPLSVNDSFER